MKERVTLTIENDLLKQVDLMIDKENIKNRSHAIELLLRKGLRGNIPEKAIILAAGKGVSLGELTKNRPQTMVFIKGKPVIQYNIELLKKFGIKDIIIHVSYMKDVIKDYFKDGSEFDISITYLETPEPVGTAGCLTLLKDKINEPFLVLNADEIKYIDLNKFYEFHNHNKAIVTIGLTTVHDTSHYGVAMLDGNKILRFIEKPKPENAPSMLISGGIFLMEPTIFKYIPEGFASLEEDVFPKLARRMELYGYPFSGKWYPTDSDEDIKRIEKIFDEEGLS